MSVLATVSAGVHGAVLLALGRPEGVRLVDTDQTAAIRSFWAIPLCLPAVVCLKLLDWLASGDAPPRQAPAAASAAVPPRPVAVSAFTTEPADQCPLVRCGMGGEVHRP